MEAIAPAVVDCGVAARPLPGEPDCGDMHVVSLCAEGVFVAALDGLGHGPDAVRAARIASSILRSHVQEPLLKLVERCHEALRATRGVVMSLASFDASRGTMEWLGIGNVQGVLVRRDPRQDAEEKSLLLRGGVAGVPPLPLLRPETVHVAPGDILVFTTDGIRTGFSRELVRTLPPQRAAESILAGHGKFTDDALVLVAKYLGKRPGTTRKTSTKRSRRAPRGAQPGPRSGKDPAARAGRGADLGRA